MVDPVVKRSTRPFSHRQGYRSDWYQTMVDYRCSSGVFWCDIPDLVMRDIAVADGLSYPCSEQLLSVPVQATLTHLVNDGMANFDVMKCEPHDSLPGLWWPRTANALYRQMVLDEGKALIDMGINSFQQDGTLFDTACANVTSLGEYYEWLHAEMQDYASFPLTFTCNINMWDAAAANHPSWLADLFDFPVCEGITVPRSANPNLPAPLDLLRQTARNSRLIFQGRMPVIVNELTSVNQNRRAIAATYALGMVAVAPWDAFIEPGERYFGPPAQYDSLYQMVASNTEVFDDYRWEREGYGEINGRINPFETDFFIVERYSKWDPEKKAVHFVPWNSPDQPLNVRFKASEYPKLPTRVITPEDPTPRSISPERVGDWWVFHCGMVQNWLVLVRP